jgi:hypothetical protein
MLNLGKDNIRNLIIDLLSGGSLKTTSLIKKIKSIKSGTTKQAVYLALRNLIREEIVVKYSRKVMLNQIWVNQLNEFANKVDKNYLENYKGGKTKNELEKMAEGDKVIYLFKNLNLFDTFWNHIFSMIIKKTNTLAPLYLYNPHEWTLLAREKSEKYMYQWIGRKRPKTCYAIGGNTYLDKLVRENYSSEAIEFSIGDKMSFKDNYYLAIIENYLIETSLDEKLAHKIDAVYNKLEDEKLAAEKIKEITSGKSRFKIAVSINSEKAAKLKKKFEKIFFIPKKIRNL